MKPIRIHILPALIFCCCLFDSSSIAQDDPLGSRDLYLQSRKQDLDAYWLDTHTWQEYGYRPHLQANTHPATNLPSYFAGKDYYSYGSTFSTPPLESMDGAGSKDRIQLTKYGTWH